MPQGHARVRSVHCPHLHDPGRECLLEVCSLDRFIPSTLVTPLLGILQRQVHGNVEGQYRTLRAGAEEKEKRVDSVD